MAITYDYGQMQNRIADELGGRSDLLVASSGMNATPIQLAIQEAIHFHENDRMYFNELRQANAFNTVLGQEFYTASDWSQIPYLKHIDKLTVIVSTNRYYMEGRTHQYMEDISINATWNGVPIDYSYYDQQLRFYPIPNGSYPVNFSGTQTFAELVNTSDTNAWVSNAEPLIRCTAKWILNRDTLRDDVGAAREEKAWRQHYTQLKSETMKRGATMRIKPSYF